MKKTFLTSRVMSVRQAGWADAAWAPRGAAHATPCGADLMRSLMSHDPVYIHPVDTFPGARGQWWRCALLRRRLRRVTTRCCQARSHGTTPRPLCACRRACFQGESASVMNDDQRALDVLQGCSLGQPHINTLLMFWLH